MAQRTSVMPQLAAPAKQDTFFFSTFLAMAIAAAVSLISYSILARNKTVASGNWMIEGWQGPPKGVSQIQCGQESSFATNLLEIFATKESTTGDGEPDLSELKLITSKLCCIKHDLMSTNQVVKSSLTLPFSTSHDRENPAETVSRCFTKSIPPRDLEISFTTWRERGMNLIDRLCTSYSLNTSEENSARKNFMSVWFDTYNVARGICSPDEDVSSKPSPRDPKGFTPEPVKGLGEYTGYY